MAIKKNKKNIDYYSKLPWTYTLEITQSEAGGPLYVVRVNELPGVMTDGPSLQEAMNLIQEAVQGALSLYLDNGEEIPEPNQIAQCKGKIAYRTSQIRHYWLAQQAKLNNVSLSQVIDQCVDKAFKK